MCDKGHLKSTRRVFTKEPGERVITVKDLIDFATARMWKLNTTLLKESNNA